MMVPNICVDNFVDVIKRVVMEPSKWKRPFRKRISLDIPEILFKKMDVARTKRNMTITKYLIRCINYILKLES